MESSNSSFSSSDKSPKPLVKGLDFYIEDGKYVFTEKFLSDRGFCCESGCRHCPYGFRKGSQQKN